MRQIQGILLLSYFIKANNIVKEEFCANLYCEGLGTNVCGIREEGKGFRLRLFENECELYKYDCTVEDKQAFGIIKLEFCQRAFFNSTNQIEKNIDELEGPCFDYDCSHPDDAVKVCGIRQTGDGFKVRLFTNKCQLIKYNCIYRSNFTVAELHICNGVDVSDEPKVNVLNAQSTSTRRTPNIFVVDASMFQFTNNITESIDNFFAATHIFDLPVDNIQKHVNETTRRMILKIFGPQVVYKPWITVPKNKSNDTFHNPTLNSCYHKCPTKCPSTYAPVCGTPGSLAREPRLMFHNHCFMDAAQCKMRWEMNSDTAESSCRLIGGTKFDVMSENI